MMDTLTKKLQSVSDDINTFVCDKHDDCKTCPFFRPKRD